MRRLHMHGSGIVADKYRAVDEQRRKIAHGRLANEGNPGRLHVRANARRNFLLTRRAKKYHSGPTIRNQAVRQLSKAFRRPAFCRAVGSAGRDGHAPGIFFSARAAQYGFRGSSRLIRNEQANRRDCRVPVNPSRAAKQLEIVVRFVFWNFTLSRHANRVGKERTAPVACITSSRSGIPCARPTTRQRAHYAAVRRCRIFLSQFGDKFFAAQPSLMPPAKIILQHASYASRLACETSQRRRDRPARKSRPARGCGGSRAKRGWPSPHRQPNSARAPEFSWPLTRFPAPQRIGERAQKLQQNQARQMRQRKYYGSFVNFTFLKFHTSIFRPHRSASRRHNLREAASSSSSSRLTHRCRRGDR